MLALQNSNFEFLRKCSQKLSAWLLSFWGREESSTRIPAVTWLTVHRRRPVGRPDRCGQCDDLGSVFLRFEKYLRIHFPKRNFHSL